jgi:two-component system nitrogen regulation response regulator GlnG
MLREVTDITPSPSRPAPTPMPVDPARPDTPRSGAPPVKYRPPSEVANEELLAALRANRWEIKPTARQLGIARPSLYLLMEKLPGLRKAVDLSRAEILEAQSACDGNLEAMVDHLEVSKPALLQRMKRLGLT